MTGLGGVTLTPSESLLLACCNTSCFVTATGDKTWLAAHYDHKTIQ